MRIRSSVWMLIGCLACVSQTFGGSAETIFQLHQTTSAPLAARQEKAQGVLQAWEVMAPLYVSQFRLNGEEDLATVQRALESLLQKQSAHTTSGTTTEVAEHLMVLAVARAQMVNSLDFSEAKLRHFFSLNAGRYSCEPRATVSELLIPKTYTDSAGTTAILDVVNERLKKESFPRVAYHINDQLGVTGTGFKGELSRQQVGAARFDLYIKTTTDGRVVGGSGDKVGGPFEVEDGWLYVQVHSLVNDPDRCFDAHRTQVAQDYGREWLKKIYSDTLTTAAAELKPRFMPYTTGTAISSPAFTVDDHTLTFAQARAALPFLMGNEKDPRFWASIQRQALEVELIYHGTTGKAIRDLSEYQALRGTLSLLASKQQELRADLETRITTATLETWFEANRSRYVEFGDVSFDLYECETSGSLNAPAEVARCSAALQQFSRRAGQDKAETGTSGILISCDTVTSATYKSQSREVQVALQDIGPGEWSPVFTEGGRPKILRLKAIDQIQPTFDDVRQRVEDDFRMSYITEFWRNLAGL